MKLLIFFSVTLCAVSVMGQGGGGNQREKNAEIYFEADQGETTLSDSTVIKRYRGHVRAWSADTELRADEAMYNSSLGETRLYGHTSLKDSIRTLSADTILYYNQRREAFAIGNVKAAEKDRTLWAHEIWYRKNDRLLIGSGGVTVKDDSLRSSITGMKMVYNDSTRNGLVIGMPSLVREDEKGSIITITASDTLEALKEKRSALLWNNVTVKKDSMTASAEKGIYEDPAEKITLLGKPSIQHIMHGTSEEDKTPIRITNVVTGDSIYIYLKNRAISSALVIGSAVTTTVAVDSTSGALTYRSVLESRKLRLGMEGERISGITAEGNADSYYVQGATKKNKDMLVNIARGDTIRFFFTEGRISTMRITGIGGGDAVGKYYRFSPAPKDTVKTENKQKQKKRAK
ncbi:MAG: LptA/OstA family protein [Candidatus Latescibacter sp.]|nr:LptA/OstA family protein [Candidatus Latescibacter sp.]